MHLLGLIQSRGSKATAVPIAPHAGACIRNPLGIKALEMADRKRADVNPSAGLKNVLRSAQLT
jgi:hypothetical protein